MREKSFDVIKITCIAILVILGLKILGIEKAAFLFSPKFVLMLQILWFIIFKIVFDKNPKDFFNKYNCILWGVVIAFTYIDGEISTVYRVLISKIIFFKTNEKSNIIFWIFINFIKFKYFILNFIVLIIIESIRIFFENRKFEYTYNIIPKKELFKAREQDLELLKNYINDDNVYGIAIDGEYGSGKSFLVDKLKENFIDKIDFINILSISANDDSVEEYVLKQIRQVMISNGVFCSSVDDILSYLHRIKFLNLFDSVPTCYEKYNDIKTKIKLIDKKVVFIVDDLDRVKNFDKIIKIFNIFELLKCKEIKCLYLYDLEILVEKFENDIECKKDIVTNEKEGKYTHLYNYIRKYIDREIFLKEIIDYNEYTKIIGNNNEAVDIFIKESNRINTKIKRKTANRKSYNHYCKFNPRVLYMIFTEYLCTVKTINMNKFNSDDVSLVKTRLIDWLIFKYHFQKLYFMFQQFDGKFEEFMLFAFKSKQGYDDIICDALNFVKTFDVISSYDELDKLEKCIFVLDLFGYSGNVWFVNNGKIQIINDKICRIVNYTGNIVKGLDDKFVIN